MGFPLIEINANVHRISKVCSIYSKANYKLKQQIG